MDEEAFGGEARQTVKQNHINHISVNNLTIENVSLLCLQTAISFSSWEQGLVKLMTISPHLTSVNNSEKWRSTSSTYYQKGRRRKMVARARRFLTWNSQTLLMKSQHLNTQIPTFWPLMNPKPSNMGWRWTVAHSLLRNATPLWQADTSHFELPATEEEDEDQYEEDNRRKQDTIIYIVLLEGFDRGFRGSARQIRSLAMGTMRWDQLYHQINAK